MRLMMLQQDFPKQKLILAVEHQRRLPQKGDTVLVSGSPDQPVLTGTVAGTMDCHEHVTAFIELPDGQSGALELQEWLQANGDVGIMIAEDG
jgi:hypothetical protein